MKMPVNPKKSIDLWCEYCGCHMDNKKRVRECRHKFTLTTKEEAFRLFPSPVYIK